MEIGAAGAGDDSEDTAAGVGHSDENDQGDCDDEGMGFQHGSRAIILAYIVAIIKMTIYSNIANSRPFAMIAITFITIVLLVTIIVLYKVMSVFILHDFSIISRRWGQ